MTEKADIVVVGGGPVGAALAVALAHSGRDVLALEAREAPGGANARTDERPLALSYGSRLILERLGVWPALAYATPIERIHVSQAGGFGRVMLDAREAALPAFGYVADYGRLALALASAAHHSVARYFNGARVESVRPEDGTPHVEYTCEGTTRTVACRLVVLADGGDLVFTPVKTRDYRQTAVTARVRAQLPHCHTAYERFTADGPLALLPAGHEMALIWTTDPTRAAVLCAIAEEEFLAALQREFGNRLGRFEAVRGRTTYPLVLRFASRITLAHTVLIGNAAQTLHPVAGQGFNMGLRDAWELAAQVKACSPEVLGDAAMLRRVEARRRVDRIGGVAFTDTLVRAFSNDFTPLHVACGTALALLDCAPALKRFVVQRMTFGARG